MNLFICQLKNILYRMNKMLHIENVLELFSGTQSFSKSIIATQKVTIDILPKFNPTIQADILLWDYTIYPPNYFTIIWCSPPCTEYSKAKTRGSRNLELADKCVKRCFEIIDYFKPKFWILENPATGLLPMRMESLRPNLRSYTADYCVYGKPYRKRTMFWSNLELKLKHCKGKGNCDQMEGSKHKGSCGNGTKRYNQLNINSVWEKDSIPSQLIQDILLLFYHSSTVHAIASLLVNMLMGKNYGDVLYQ